MQRFYDSGEEGTFDSVSEAKNDEEIVFFGQTYSYKDVDIGRQDEERNKSTDYYFPGTKTDHKCNCDACVGKKPAPNEKSSGLLSNMAGDRNKFGLCGRWVYRVWDPGGRIWDPGG